MQLFSGMRNRAKAVKRTMLKGSMLAMEPHPIYVVPDDAVQLFDKALVHKALMREYAAGALGRRKAIRAGMESYRLKRLFWGRVKSMYPELQHIEDGGCRLTYHPDLKVVKVVGNAEVRL